MMGVSAALSGIFIYFAARYVFARACPWVEVVRRAYFARRHQSLVREQFPDALYLLSGALRAGLTLEQAFHIFLTESPEPLKNALLSRVTSGDTWLPFSQQIEKAFFDPEWLLLRQALILSSAFGSGLVEVVEEGIKLLKAKKTVRKKFEVLTAQSRATAWIVGLAPFFIMLLLWLFSPEFLTPFLQTTPGRRLLAFIVILDGAGLAVVRRMLRVRL